MILSVQQIQGINICCILVFVYFAYRGYKNGLLFSMFSLAASLGSIFIAFYMAQSMNGLIQIAPSDYGAYSSFITQTLLYDRINLLCLWFISFILIRICAALLLPILKGLNHIPLLGSMNRIIGLFFGGLQSIIIYIIMIFILSSPFIVNGSTALEETNLIYIKDVLRLDDSNGLFYDVQQIQHMIDGKEIEEVRAWLHNKGFNQQQIIEIILLMEGQGS